MSSNQIWRSQPIQLEAQLILPMCNICSFLCCISVSEYITKKILRVSGPVYFNPAAVLPSQRKLVDRKRINLYDKDYFLSMAYIYAYRHCTLKRSCVRIYFPEKMGKYCTLWLESMCSICLTVLCFFFWGSSQYCNDRMLVRVIPTLLSHPPPLGGLKYPHYLYDIEHQILNQPFITFCHC